MPFPALQGLFDGLLPKGMQWYWKGDFVRELTDAAINEGNSSTEAYTKDAVRDKDAEAKAKG